MSIHKTEAIVLKKWPVRETSLAASLFTRNYGKIKGQFKGIYERCGKFGSSVEVFSLNEIVFYRSRNSEFHLVSHCDSGDNFNNMRFSPETFYAAAFVCELTDALMQEEDVNGEVFYLLRECLRIINGSGNPSKAAVIFQIKMLKLCGFKPHFDSCLCCFEGLAGEAFFSFSQGGIICPKCRAKAQDAHSVSKGTVASILYIQNADLKEAMRIQLGKMTNAEIRSMLEAFLEYHLERKLRSRRFVSLDKVGLFLAQEPAGEPGLACAVEKRLK